MTTVNSEARQGNPAAIAAIINKSLDGKDITAKVSSNNGCLVIVLESQTNVRQEALASFIKSGIVKLRPSNISNVIIRSRVSGRVSDAWKESFSLKPFESGKRINQDESDKPSNVAPSTQLPSSSKSRVIVNSAKENSDVLVKLKSLATTRNGERAAIALGTFLLTSGLWMSIGFLAGQKDSATADRSSPATQALEKDASPVSDSYALVGTLTLSDIDIAQSSSTCYGTGGYDDIQPGMSVTVRDGNGNIIASGKAGSGSILNADEPWDCVFGFKVDNVPKADFYSIEVGHRGELNYSFAEMQEQNWQVSFSLH